MEEGAKKAVERAIEAMRDKLGEDLTVEEMARTAMFSKFHFSRIFQRVTGISPGRFLSAMRLQKAKQLLISTSLSVTEISHRVGYSSVGTFSSRFSSSVGVSPRTYRRLGGVTAGVVAGEGGGTGGRRSMTVQGTIWAPGTGPGHVMFIGLFPDPVPRGRPASCATLQGPGPYALSNVPVGTWYVLAYAVAASAVQYPFVGDQGAFVGCHGPFTVRPETRTHRVDLRLRPMYAFDPPVVLAFLDLRSSAPRLAS